MADADAVRGAGVPERLPSTEPPAGSGAPPAEPSAVMSLVDHLTELRTRIVRSIFAVVVGSAIGFVAAPAIEHVLVSPLPASALPLQTLGPGDGFAITLRIAVAVGIVLAMPVLLYQLWAFVSPGLTASERRALRPWIPLALFFFALGTFIAWIVLPFAAQFLVSFSTVDLQPLITAGSYFDFVTTLFLVFGLVMEFPILLVGLSRVGIVTSQRLASSRRMVILGIAIFAAVATPGGDLVSPFVLGGTMYVLYELTVLFIKRSGR